MWVNFLNKKDIVLILKTGDFWFFISQIGGWFSIIYVIYLKYFYSWNVWFGSHIYWI